MTKLRISGFGALCMLNLLCWWDVSVSTALMTSLAWWGIGFQKVIYYQIYSSMRFAAFPIHCNKNASHVTDEHMTTATTKCWEKEIFGSTMIWKTILLLKLYSSVTNNYRMRSPKTSNVTNVLYQTVLFFRLGV